MWLFNRLRRGWRALFERHSLERDMDDEMRFHLDQEIAAYVATGMSPEEARRRALASFGGVERHKEAARDLAGVRWIEDAARDARYALKALRRQPGFAITTTLTLAVGISATTLVFSAIETLFLRELPVREAGRLFVVDEQWKNGGVPASDAAQPTYPYEHYLDIVESTPTVFSDVVASQVTVSAVRLGGYATDVTGYIVSSNYFAALGVRPAAGRFFSAASERAADAPPEVVIGEEFWERRFNRDPSVLGKTLYADSRELTIVGVAPQAFHGTIQGIVADLWLPAGVMRHSASTSADSIQHLDNPFVAVFGRLRPGLTVRQAEAALTTIGLRLPPEHQMGGRPQIRAIRLDALSGIPPMARGSFVIFMSMLMATAALVLLIAVANVAGMLLARGAYRRREIAMRLALGASRSRVTRQLLTESLILCALGAIGGVLLARWAFMSIPGTLPAVPIHVAFDIRFDPRVFGVIAAVTIVSGILAGLTPALQATRVDVLSGLRGSPQGQSTNASRARDAFVVAQLALSLALLVSAGLFIRALARGFDVDPGFDPRGVVAARVDLGAHGYDKDRGRALFAQLLARLRARPEVAEASLGWWTPLSNGYNGDAVYLPGEQPPTGRRLGLGYAIVDGDFLRMMHVRMASGRSLRSTDDESAPPVVVINETAARRLWPSESAIGHRIKMGNVDREIVGVARDGKYHSLDEPPTAFAFVPYLQRYQSNHYYLYVRARTDSSAVGLVMRQELAALDPNVALEAAAPLSRQLALFLYPQEVAAIVIGIFGSVGLLLAIVGTYGVIAYHVNQRTREFGIRLALGAGPAGVARLVLGRGARLIGLGIAVGVVLALALGMAARGFLFGLGAADPITFGGVSLLLAAVALCATYLPARRAAAVDPMNSLRSE